MKTKALPYVNTVAGARQAAKAVGAAVLSFLLGAGRLLGAVSPFSAALVCGLPVRYALTAGVGGIVSAIAFSRAGFVFYHIAQVVLALGARLALARIFRRRIRPLFLSLIAFGITSLCTALFALSRGSAGLELILLILECLLCGCCTYFFAVGGNALLRKQRGVLSYMELSSLCILAVAALSSLARFSLFQVNLGVIAGVTAVYVVMSRYGLLGASVSSIIVSISLCLYSMEMLEFCGLLIIAGFLAGVFTPLGKFGQMAAFVVSSTFCLLLMGAPVFLTYRLIDVFLATAVFVILPERWLNRIRPAGDTAASAVINPAFMQESVAARLSFASDTIRDLEGELEDISNRFGEIDYNNISTIYDTAANTVCKGCSRMLACWDDHYSDTLNAFNPLSDTLRLRGEVTRETLPTYFQAGCCKTDQLCAVVNSYYRAFVAKQNTKRQIAESRRIVFEQFHSIADMLWEVSQEIGQVSGYDEGMTRSVAAVYRKLEAEPEQVICTVDRYGRSCVEIYTAQTVRTSPAALCEAISTASQRDFDLPSISRVGQKTKLALFERASYSIDLSVQQSCVGDNTVCGDSWEYFTDPRGYAYLLISDGMGNGKRAAIDSVMTCSILSKLIKAGFGLESAIRMINSSLLVKSTDESLATVDMAKVDLYSGETEFCKAGASSTFLYQRGEIRRVESSSLPVGILQGVGFQKSSATLREGDLLLMLSDGALSAGEGWITSELRKGGGRTAQELAVRICTEAKERCQSLHPDDITVLAARVVKG